MRLSSKIMIVIGPLLALGLAASPPAGAATPSAPSLQTADFACSGSVCTPGPGNVGSPYAAELLGQGGPTYLGPECVPYTMSIAGGSLPPGLSLGLPGCEWEITGTPSQAGTYTFTVQITPQPNNLGQPAGPSGTAQLSITIGTGKSDRLFATGASWVFKGGTGIIQLFGWDPNAGATYTLMVNGKANGTVTDTAGVVYAHGGADPAPTTVTLTDSLGSSVTVPVTVVHSY